MWPFVLSGVLALLLVAGAATVLLVRRAPTPVTDQLADGVSVGGTMTGDAQKLADVLTKSGLECSVRFTSADGGHAGCFAATSSTTIATVYQYHSDGTVSALTIDVKAKGDTAPTLLALTTIVGKVVFPADMPELIAVMRQSWGGASEGSWGKYEMMSRGPKTVLNAEKSGNKQLEVPVLHLDTTEPDLAKGLTADGYSCTADNETCQHKPGFALKFSGPNDGGLTYLVATAVPDSGFEQLRATVFGHLHGAAVAPVQEWIGAHLDGRSHVAYVAGWRVSLEAVPGKQTRLTLFNDEFFLQMT
ncbi:MAG: hypothetical protein HOV67_04995 [Kribbellaceae bacterium]|nr:hypothetical protein [Kribbellaceae bacterium]